MSQTTLTVNQLINNAFYFIGEFDAEEPIPGDAFEGAFQTLNQIINEFSTSEIFIPITKVITFNLIPNQKSYVFSNLPNVIATVNSNRIVNVQYCNLLIESVLYAVRPFTAGQVYWNSFNTEQSGIPAIYELITSEEFSQINFFPTPNANYTCELRAKFYLDKFEKFKPIINIPLSTQRFFMYALARELKQIYPSSNWSPEAEKEYQRLHDNLVSTNDIDLMARTTGLLNTPYGYGFWNIRTGFFP